MKELTYQDQEKLLIALSGRWNIAKMIMRLGTTNDDVLTAHEHFDVMMTFFYNQLDDDCKAIYEKTYLRRNMSKWYTEFYSKSNYYRKKRIIIETFVHCLQIFKMLK
ncbi:MAG: hypothetical protein KGZ51_03045 [Erysipelothrix sp.]|jgi:hypothetical protein|nr:hypothetical protein [Erysipelothrix sp.]